MNLENYEILLLWDNDNDSSDGIDDEFTIWNKEDEYNKCRNVSCPNNVFLQMFIVAVSY